jgi:hypothetical protein
LQKLSAKSPDVAPDELQLRKGSRSVRIKSQYPVTTPKIRAIASSDLFYVAIEHLADLSEIAGPFRTLTDAENENKK